MSVNFPEHWRLLELEDVMDAIIDYRGKTPKKTEFGIPLITAKIVKNGKILESTEFIAEDNYTSWMTRGIPNVGDIVVTTEAPLGEVAQLNNSNVALAQRIVTLRGKKGVLQNDFLLFALQSNYVQHQLDSRSSGSTVKGIKQSELRKVLLPIPPESEQIKIAIQLKALDSKISLNQKINQTLEQMAQALFKSWFVDFDPVKAKISAKDAWINLHGAIPATNFSVYTDYAKSLCVAAMSVISGKTTAQLETFATQNPEQYESLKATADLFPDAMQESELGNVPEGWAVKQAADMVELIGGGTPKKSEPLFWDGDICWFSVKDVPSDGNVFVIDTNQKITTLGLQKSSTKLLPLGATIITARGTVGKLALTGVPTAMNQSCYGVRGANGIGPFLNYFNISHAVTTLKQNTHGAVFDTITMDTFKTVYLVESSDGLKQRFEEMITPFLSGIKSKLFEIKHLTQLRDTLLPKLLSGEVSPFKVRIVGGTGE